MRRSPADRPVVAVKPLLAGVAVKPRGRLTRNVRFDQPGPMPWEEAKMNMPKPEDKPFVIPKPMVWEAYRRVAANKGAPGVDGQALEQFEADLRDNLYKIWNRMSSGSYFPPPVRAVEIPKPHGGGVRLLGVPTIADRVAQTVVAMYLEPRVEPRFHADSYGYRPGKSAHQAIETCRARCWKFDWTGPPSQCSDPGGSPMASEDSRQGLSSGSPARLGGRTRLSGPGGRGCGGPASQSAVVCLSL